MASTYLNILKRLFCSQTIKPKICIVGAGPAGFYAAQQIVKILKEAQVDIYEKLPVPFGLVRFGVAPDHPEVKNVINTFSKTAQHPNVRFIGNVSLGKDITLKQLKDAYHGVLLTYGAEESRKLNIPGESLQNIIEARRIVGWYNGVPWDADLKIDLSGETAAIFGQGNVAIDVARILLTPVDKLKETDITAHALDAISKSKVKKVYLIGRRGPLQAAFTIKELREMLKLDYCHTKWCEVDFTGVPEVVPHLARPKKRITELMLNSLKIEDSDKKNTTFLPMFFRSPLEFQGTKNVESIKLGINKLKGEDFLKQRAVLTDKTETLNCDLAVTSIGYKSTQMDVDIPFDYINGVAVNENGKVDDKLYAAGWLATGPTGVILTTMSNAFAIAESMSKHLKVDSNKPGFEAIVSILRSNNLQTVDWKGWLKIDKYEVEQGKIIGKPREKVLDIKKMLQIAQ